MINPNAVPHVDYSAIPLDFPRPEIEQSSLGRSDHALRLYGCEYFESDSSPLAVLQTWQIAEELAQHLAGECLQEKTCRSPLLSEDEIIESYFKATLQTGWGTEPEIAWVFRRVASLLNWPTPDGAATCSAG